MIDKNIIALEDAFDRGELSSIDLAQHEAMTELISMFVHQDWRAAAENSLNIFSRVHSVQQKAFVIQWGVGASEVCADLTLREKILKLWDELPNWIDDSYAQYLHAFQRGLTLFYDAHLVEAETVFNHALSIAKKMEYARGEMRSLFHLGLVARDRRLTGKALCFFEQSRAIANTRSAQSFINRIEVEVSQLSGDQKSFSDEMPGKIRFLESLVTKGDFVFARRLLHQLEKERRQYRLGHKKWSLIVYLPVIHWSRKKPGLAHRVLQTIKDPVVRLRAMELLSQTGFSGPDLSKEMIYLCDLHLIATRFRPVAGDPLLTVINGVRLSSIEDQEVQKLVLVLVQNPEGLSKEQIAEKIWNNPYDPLYHDAKIYKLLHRTRSLFNSSDLIKNTYGGYRLIPIRA